MTTARGKLLIAFTVYQEWGTRPGLVYPREPIICCDPQGTTALAAFGASENGETISCREPELLRTVLRGKAALNLQIKQWAEGIRAGLFALREFQEAFPELPEWVWNAVLGQTHGLKADFSWAYR